MAVARYLADTSALARLPQQPVSDRLGPLLTRGLVATCSVVDLEVLWSTRSPEEFARVARQRRGFERLDTEQRDWDRAQEVQQELWTRGCSRAVGIPDLLVSAVAERHGVTLLHYDRDYELVAAVTGQPVEWVVAPGSVP